MSRRMVVCVAILPALACVDSRWNVCDTSLICPEDRVCDLYFHRCSEPACLHVEDGQVCTVESGISGICTAGQCGQRLDFVCGDGTVNRAEEECDGQDLHGQTCRSLGFYEDTTELGCDSGCQFDTTACQGTCKDGRTSLPHEICDPTDPQTVSGFCVTRGHSAGILECSDTCTDLLTDACDDFGWKVSFPGLPTTPPADGIGQIWGADGQLIVLGRPTGMRWFDGQTWRDWPGGYPTDRHLPPEEAPEAIWGTSMNDFWIAFPSGFAHWQASRWSFMPYVNEIFALWGSAGDDIFGLGDGDRIHHYDGERWSSEAAPVMGRRFYAISGSGPDNAYAISDDVMINFDGHRWALNEGPSNMREFSSLTSIWTSAPDDVWVAAFLRYPRELFVYVSAYRFDGVAWRTIQDVYLATSSNGSSAIRIAGRSRDDLWFVSSPIAERFDGDGWLNTPATGFSDPGVSDSLVVRKIWVDRAFVALAGKDRVAIWGETGQFQAGYATDVRWTDVCGSLSSDWVAVGSNGTNGIAYHETGGLSGGSPDAPETRSLPEPLHGVAGFSGSDVYATGVRGSIYHFDGRAWTTVREPPGGDFAGPLFIQAVGASEVYVLERYAGAVLSRFDGAAWSIQPLDDGCDPTSMWAVSPDDIWFSCGSGESRLLHLEGDAMSFADPQGVASLWGSGPDDVYALVPPRTVWHYDGTGWSSEEVGLETASFFAIRGRAADDVFALGSTGDMAHFDGRVWQPTARLKLRNSTRLRAMVVMSNVLVAVGDGSESEEKSGLEGLVRTRLWDCRSCERDRDNRIDDDCDGQTDELDEDCQRWSRGGRP